MPKIKVDDLLTIAKKISSRYQVLLKEEKTQKNVLFINELLQQEQFLYDFIAEEEYQKYILEMERRFPKSKATIYENMCGINFSAEKRVLWYFCFLRDMHSVKKDSTVLIEPEFRFNYGDYFEFFNYLQVFYFSMIQENLIKENNIVSLYLYKSLLSLSFIYPYIEKSFLLENKGYLCFRKSDFESLLGVSNFSFLKDQLYLKSIYTFIESYSNVNPIIYQDTLKGNLTRIMMEIYFTTMLFMVDSDESIDILFNDLHYYISDFSKETQDFIKQMADRGHQRYLKRNEMLYMQEHCFDEKR